MTILWRSYDHSMTILWPSYDDPMTILWPENRVILLSLIKKLYVKLYFFIKKVWKLRKNSYLCTEIYAITVWIPACPRVGGHNKHRWNETSGQLYAQSRKDVFERYCLDTQTSQLWIYLQRWCNKKRSRGLILYPPTANIPFIYIIRCMPVMGVLSLRI